MSQPVVLQSRGAARRRARVLAALILASVPPLARAGAHYEQPPCQPDEVQGEVQGASGYVCAPRCEENTYNCPLELPGGATAQPQCMLQDVGQKALCGLLCQADAQCPSGAQCKQLRQMQVGICLYPISFADWARQGSTQKLAVGWPTKPGQAGLPLGAQIAKTYAALQSLKSKYSIDDGDADVLVLKELLSSLKAPGTASSPASSSSGGAPLLGLPAAAAAPGGAAGGSSWLPHDVTQLEGYVGQGLPGLERELHDTAWNVEHIGHRNAAWHLLSGVLWVVALYLGVGGFFKYNQGARGVDMIPHASFWMEYPQLVLDGVAYSKILLGMQGSNDAQPLSGGIVGGIVGGGGGASLGAVHKGSGSFDPL